MRKTTYVNKLYPGLPNYTGPREGWFAFLHHSILCEMADFGGVMERVEYVRRHKPKDEVDRRLMHMLYLGPVLSKALTKDGRGSPGMTKRVMAYVKEHLPHHSWKGGTLYKADGKRMTG